MSLLQYRLAQHGESSFGINFGEIKNVLAPIPAGPALLPSGAALADWI